MIRDKLRAILAQAMDHDATVAAIEVALDEYLEWLDTHISPTQAEQHQPPRQSVQTVQHLARRHALQVRQRKAGGYSLWQEWGGPLATYYTLAEVRAYILGYAYGKFGVPK